MELGVIADWLLGLASFFKDNDSVGLIIFIFLCALIVSVARTYFGDLYKNFCLRLAGERLREGRAGARDIDDKWRAIADTRAFLARYEFPQVQAQWAQFEAVLADKAGKGEQAAEVRGCRTHLPGLLPLPCTVFQGPEYHGDVPANSRACGLPAAA